MKGKTDEEKADKIVAFLNGEAFEFYFDHFTEDNAPTTEASSFQNVEKAFVGGVLLEENGNRNDERSY